MSYNPVFSQSTSTPTGSFFSVYAVSSNAIAGSDNNKGLWYSSDRGVTWTQSNKTTGTFYSVYMVGTNAIAGSAAGLWYSTNSGQTWTVSTQTTNFFFSVYMAGTNAIAGGGNNNGLWYSSNSGVTWAQSNKTTNNFNSVYMVGSNVIAGSNNGLWYSSNSGQTWAQSTQTTGGVITDYINSVYMVGTNAIAGSGNGLWYSTNSGVTWTKSNTTNGNSVYMVGTNAIAGGTGNGLWYSTNSGQTWSRSNITTNGFSSVYMVGTNAIAGGGGNNGLWYSSNSGVTWAQSNKTTNNFRSVYMVGSNVIAGSFSNTGLWYYVEPVPTEPLNVSAVPGNTQVTVTWSAPSSDGGSTITGYTVICSDLSIPNVNVNGTTYTANVAGLTNGNSYTFTVTATNAVGTGPASSPSNSVIPFQYPCFKSGSKILTSQGYKLVEDLRKGDLVKTLLNDYLPIVLIGKRDIYHPASKDRIKDQLYVCSQANYPEVWEDLVLTGCHSILVDDFANEKQKNKATEINSGRVCVTDRKYRLPTCADERSYVYEKPGTYTIYHLALENDDYYTNYGIYANGLLVETCSKRYLTELANMELIDN
jgi:hypothetical protein